MFDKEFGLGEGGKPMLVKAVVAKGAIEAFNESVLHGLSRLDVMKGDARRLSPEVKGFAGQLRAIVQSDDLWQGTGQSELLKHINDGGTTDGGIDMDRQALTGKVIDDRQTTETTSTGELIVDEIHRPALVGTLWLRDWNASQGGQLLSTFCGAGIGLPRGRCVQCACG
jgi:hypothetical protein